MYGYQQTFLAADKAKTRGAQKGRICQTTGLPLVPGAKSSATTPLTSTQPSETETQSSSLFSCCFGARR